MFLYFGKHAFANSTKVWVHLAFLDAEGLKKIREGSSDRNGNMHLLPTALTNHSLFHEQNFTRKCTYLSISILPVGSIECFI